MGYSDTCYACPRCHHRNDLSIEVMAVFAIDSAGEIDTSVFPEVSLDEAQSIHCGDCGYTGSVESFEEEPNTNTGLLEGVRCPECRQFEAFIVHEVKVVLRVSDGAFELEEEPDRLADYADLECPECSHTGTVAEFRED